MTVEILKKIYLRWVDLVLNASYVLQKMPWSLRQDMEIPARIREYNRGCEGAVRDGIRVLALHIYMNMVRDLPAGDYAELGCYRGNFARLLYALKAEASTLSLFDTFSGFDERDVKAEKSVTNIRAQAGEFSAKSLDKVRSNVLADRPGDGKDLELIPGFFPETFSGFENRSWRFVSLDADLYEPMKAGIECFWPRLVPGGIMMIHDYLGGYFGMRKAVDEYFGPLGMAPVPIPDAVGTAVVIKPLNASSS